MTLRRTPKPMPSWVSHMMLALPMLLGTALLLGAGWATWSELAFRAAAAMADAHVVEIRTSSRRDTNGVVSVMHYPVFDFALPDGRRVRAVGPVGSGAPCCAVGEAVRVRYDPARPERAARDSFEDSWLLPTVLAAFGALMFGAGVLVLVVFGPSPRAPPDRAGSTPPD